MTVAIINTLANSSTFVSTWRQRTNELADAMTTKAVTVESNSAVGNAAIVGHFHANGLHTDTIGGGNLSSTSNLTFTTNTVTQGNAFFSLHTHLGAAANVHVLAGNATHRFLVTNTGGVSGLAAIRPNTSDIDNISIVSPSQGQALVFDNATAKWINQSYVQTANDASLLGGQPNSFYTNASNLGTGTVPVARVNGAYTSINAVGTLANLVVTGNVLTSGRVGIGNVTPGVSLHVTGTDGVVVPVGNTGQRPASVEGTFRLNSETAVFEGYFNGGWANVGSFYGGVLTSKLTTLASNATTAHFNVPHGTTTPSGAVNGDFWTNSTAVGVRVGSANKSFAFLEGGTYTGNVTFQSNVVAQNVSVNFITASQFTGGVFFAGNTTVNVVVNSTAIAFSNTTQVGVINIQDASREFVQGVIVGRMNMPDWPVPIGGPYWPFAATIRQIKWKTDLAATTNATFYINGIPINGTTGQTANTTLKTANPSSNNVLAVGDVLSVNCGGGASAANFAFYIELDA